MNGKRKFMMGIVEENGKGVKGKKEIAKGKHFTGFPQVIAGFVEKRKKGPCWGLTAGRWSVFWGSTGRKREKKSGYPQCKIRIFLRKNFRLRRELWRVSQDGHAIGVASIRRAVASRFCRAGERRAFLTATPRCSENSYYFSAAARPLWRSEGSFRPGGRRPETMKIGRWGVRYA